MKPVWGFDADVAAWVAARIPDCARGFGECVAMGVVNCDAKPVAGVVFHDWSPERGLIEISCAATDRRWLTRRVAQEAMGYAFRVARMVVTRTAEENEPVRKIWRALGASEHVLPEMWGPKRAMILYTLTLPQWQASRLARRA